MFGLLGGFAAPILLSSGSGNYIALFSYYAILNLAVLIIGRFQLWRGLNLLAFVCTFAVSIIWVLKRYQPEMFVSAEPFMLLFMVMFTYLGIQSAKRGLLTVKNFMDIPLTLGTPLLGAIIQWRIFSHIEHGLPLVCLAFAAVYLLLTFGIWKRQGVSMRRLAQGYLGLAVLLTNLAIPLELSAQATSAVWAAEGLLAFYFGKRLFSLPIKILGLLLHAAAAIAFALRDVSHYYIMDNYQVPPFLRDPGFIGAMIIALSALLIAVLANRMRPEKSSLAQAVASQSKVAAWHGRHYGKLDNIITNLLVVWGMGWWFVGWWHEMNRACALARESYFIVLSMSALLGFALARLTGCRQLRWATIVSVAYAFCHVSYVVIARLFDGNYILDVLTYNFFAGYYLWGWLLFFASQAALLYYTRHINQKLHAFWLFLILLTSVGVLTCTGRAFTEILALSESWKSLAGILPALAFVMVLSRMAPKRVSLVHRKVMLFYLPLLLCCATTAWFLGTLFSAGNPDPLPVYIPLLNPLDLMQAFSIMIIALWQLQAGRADGIRSLSRRALITIMDIMVFLWLTAMVARASHYLFAIPMSGLAASGQFHLLLFILWGLYGIGHIIAGHKLPLRRVWLAGAALTVVDIAKLLLVDLAHTETITRIISFFVAGLLLLFIGWVAPLPPASPQPKQDKEVS